MKDSNLSQSKMIQLLMFKGKKRKAFNVLIQAFSFLKQQQTSEVLKGKTSGEAKAKIVRPYREPVRQNSSLSPHVQMQKALKHTVPYLEVRKVRISGTTRQIPAMIKQNRQIKLATRWILEAASQRAKKRSLPFYNSLALEILEASQRRGPARQRRDELHQTVKANRPYLRYRWW